MPGRAHEHDAHGRGGGEAAAHDVRDLPELAYRVLQAAHRGEVVARVEDLEDVLVLLAEELDLAPHDGGAGEGLAASASALERRPPSARAPRPPVSAASSSGVISQRTSEKRLAQVGRELRAGREVRPGDGHDLGPRRARVDLVRDLARRRERSG